MLRLTHQDKATEAEDLRKLIAHAVLEVLGLHLGHGTTGKIKYLLTVNKVHEREGGEGEREREGEGGRERERERENEL